MCDCKPIAQSHVFFDLFSFLSNDESFHVSVLVYSFLSLCFFFLVQGRTSSSMREQQPRVPRLSMPPPHPLFSPSPTPLHRWLEMSYRYWGGTGEKKSHAWSFARRSPLPPPCDVSKKSRTDPHEGASSVGVCVCVQGWGDVPPWLCPPLRWHDCYS